MSKKRTANDVANTLFDALLYMQMNKIPFAMKLEIGKDGVLGWRINLNGYHAISGENAEQIFPYLAQAVGAIIMMLSSYDNGHLPHIEIEDAPLFPKVNLIKRGTPE